MGMWWEIIPVFGICVGLAAAPHWLIRGVHKAVYGTQFNRDVKNSPEWYLYQRDRDHSPPSLLSVSRRYYNKNTGVGEGRVHKSFGLEAYE